MQVITMVQNRPTVLSSAQLATHIDSKATKRVIRGPMLTHCANAIIGHNGVNTGGGCPAHVTYQGRIVFHASRGQKGRTDGCTVFFASAAALGGADMNAAAVLLAVGRHDRDVKRQPHYVLDWRRRGFLPGQNVIQF